MFPLSINLYNLKILKTKLNYYLTYIDKLDYDKLELLELIIWQIEKEERGNLKMYSIYISEKDKSKTESIRLKHQDDLEDIWELFLYLKNYGKATTSIKERAYYIAYLLSKYNINFIFE